MSSKALLWILEDSPASQFVYEETLGDLYALRFFDSIDDFKRAPQPDGQKPQLILADLRLRDGNFLDFLGTNEAQLKVTCPFMVISSLDDLEILRACFQEGAADYMTKPFTRNELVVKVERNLARLREIALDPASFRLKRGDEALAQLTPKELQIFTILQNAQGRPVPRSKLQHEIWGSTTVSHKSLDVHLFHLRKKIGPAGLEIVFVANQGFVLRDPSSATETPAT